MNYNELKEIVTRHGFVLDKYDDNKYRSISLYIHANNTMFDDTNCGDVLATAKFGSSYKLISIIWFDKLTVSKKLLVFSGVKKGEDYDSKDLIQKIEKRLGCVQMNIKKVMARLKLQEINKDFERCE